MTHRGQEQSEDGEWHGVKLLAELDANVAIVLEELGLQYLHECLVFSIQFGVCFLPILV